MTILEKIKTLNRFNETTQTPLDIGKADILTFIYSLAVLHGLGLVQEQAPLLTGKGFDLAKDLFDMGYRLSDNDIAGYFAGELPIVRFAPDEAVMIKALIVRLNELGYDEMKKEVEEFLKEKE